MGTLYEHADLVTVFSEAVVINWYCYLQIYFRKNIADSFEKGRIPV